MTKRLAFIVSGALLLSLLATSPGCAATELLSYRLWPDHPRDLSERIALSGLGGPVSIHLDEAGVPHVDAADERDLLFGIGFVQARERFFSMDSLRRVARGRLSELVGARPMLGSTTVEFDLTMRGWGFDELAQQDVDEVDAELRALLEAFVAGVNAGLARRTPIEYRLFEVEPEPWTLQDSFAVGRLNAWSVSHNWSQELSRLLLALYGGVERAEALYPSKPWPGPPAMQSQQATRELPPAITDEIRALFPPRPVERVSAGPLAARFADFPEGASNAWTVGGARSRSGKPLLASDPHLSHFLPSLMFQQHIRAPGIEAMGITMAGLPYIIMGHTREVAWGMTSAVADVIDLCVERQNPDRKDQVLTPEGWRTLQREEHVIRVREGDDSVEHRMTVRRSHNGPLLNDLYPDLLPDWAPLISVRWDTRGTGASVAALRAANSASSVEALRQAVSTMVTPINTYVAADVHGTVALFSNGKVPLRRHHLGTFPIPGWLERYQWGGFVAPMDMPFAAGGDEAVFAHGNTLMWDPAKSPYLYQIDSAPSYRRDRIVDLLASRDQHDLRSFGRMQRDVTLYRARRLVPHMLEDLERLDALNPLERRARQLLGDWDYVATQSSVAAAIFWETYREAMLAGTVDEVGAEVLPFLLARRYYINAVDLWYDRVDHPAWDDRRTAVREQRSDVVQAAFRRAVRNLRRTLGTDIDDWRWGRLHAMQPRHLMGGVKLLADLVNLPRAEMGGGPDAVWKTHFEIKADETDFSTNAGPVYRMLVDLADIEHGLWVLDAGSSGWPGSAHYGDQYRRYVRGAYFPMLMNWDEIAEGAAATLTLQPQ